MQLIAILLIVVAVLTLLSGIAVFFGAVKGEKARSAWFFGATIFATLWMIPIAIFLVATPEWDGPLDLIVQSTYLSGIFIDIALLGYIAWRTPYGKVMALTFLTLGIIIAIAFMNSPGLLYTEIKLASTGNSLTTNVGPFYIIYVAFFCLLVPAVMFTLIRHIITTSSSRVKRSELVLLIGFGISGTMALIFNLILPFWRWDLVWIGPLAISTTILAFYYTVLRYRALDLSSRWLQVLSYVVIIASSAVLYMVIFDLIFMAMFRSVSPSVEVISLNFIMILIVLLLFPAMNEINMFIRSLISNQRIDMVYIIKKLSKITPQGINIDELAMFLAEHMHFEYIGILVNGKVYGSAEREFTKDGLKMVEEMGDPERGVWQEFDEDTKIWKELDLSAVAALRNASGVTFGQVMIGKPEGNVGFNRRDLVQVETIINLVAVIIDSKTHTEKA